MLVWIVLEKSEAARRNHTPADPPWLEHRWRIAHEDFRPAAELLSPFGIALEPAPAQHPIELLACDGWDFDHMVAWQAVEITADVAMVRVGRRNHGDVSAAPALHGVAADPRREVLEHLVGVTKLLR